MNEAMPNPHLIGPRAEPTPAKTGTSRSHAGAIPYDLLQEASRRLGILSLLAGALWALATVLYHLATPETNHGSPAWFYMEITDVISGVAAIVSLALFAYTRRKTENPRFILDLGLGYIVLTSFALSLISHWDHGPEGLPIRPMISWAGVAMLLFAAIVPSCPPRFWLQALSPLP